uniref:Uncharacterized protein n=1 Tax=Sus scrofa TaxID=9823 RepID=A0A8D0IVR2_PIG
SAWLWREAFSQFMEQLANGQYAHSGLFILVMIYPGFKREADAGVAKPTVLRSMTLDL